MSRGRWWEIALILGLFVVAVAIRAYALDTILIYPDELTYGYRAIHILAGGWWWPRAFMWDQPPLQIYLLAIVNGAFGGGIDTMRWTSVIAGSLTVVLAYLLGKSMYGRKAGIIASLAIAVDGYQIEYSRIIYIEALASMLILASLLFFWEGIVKKKDLRLALIGGMLFGLALDSKYVTMAAGVALVLFLLVYKNRFPNGFPRREVIAFFAAGIIMFLPVLLAFATANVDPFYYDLQYRFQLAHVSALAGAVRSGQLFAVGLTHLVQVFFHVSSTAPFQVFPLLVVDIPIWIGLVAIVIAFFLGSLLLRRNLADGLLVILFAGLLLFAFAYPDRKSYFFLYPSLVLLIMLGRVTLLGLERFKISNKAAVQVAAAGIIVLASSAIFLNAAAVPATYRPGFGDWDEIQPIMNYIAQNHAPNAYLATTTVQVALYSEIYHTNVSVAYMKQPSAYFSQPPINQTLLAPVQGTYPIIWVISASAIQKLNPQFVVMPANDFQALPATFQTYITERYYRPLDTQLVLIFQLR